ncbi:MucBP domain-containing protein [Listeria sp. PSOL-1]|uniref:MucBP domain-containing protein n=1 Tax=Listeria sp. PSOL-1 TaxID=1844999 RepID=UPI0013D2E085|nr:MucBP domain-containing protein [Listeria sp. PSOL-1]
MFVLCKKIWLKFIVAILAMSVVLFPVHLNEVKAEEYPNILPPEWDVSANWDILSSSTNLNFPENWMDLIFLQNDFVVGKTVQPMKRVLVNVANIDAKFEAERVFHLKKGCTYRFKLNYGIRLTGKASVKMDFDGSVVSKSNTTHDDLYKETIVADRDRDYKIKITVDAPKNTNVYFMLGYGVNDLEGGVKVTEKGLPVVVNHIDEKGATLAKEELYEGNVGETYKTQAKKIAGYKLKRVIGKEEDVFSKEIQKVIYEYTPVDSPIEEGKVTVQYVEQNNHKLRPDQLIKGTIDKAYNVSIPDIAGYELQKVDGNAHGVFTKSEQIVKLVYRKIATNTKGSIRIQYVDEKMNEIRTPETRSGNLDEAYQVIPKQIKNYRFKKAVNNLSGKYEKEAKTITLVYSSVKNDADTNRTLPEKKAKKEPSQEMPKTGDAPIFYWVIIGLLILSSSLVVCFLKTKRFYR